jgi:hypothetical protein
VSSISQGLLFELDAMSADEDGIYTAYFRDGVVQVCPARIEYAPFDEAELRPPPARPGLAGAR